MSGTVKVNKLRFAELFVGTSAEVLAGNAPDFACQAETWKVVNNTGAGDKGYTFCYDPNDSSHPNEGEYREETEPDWTLDGTFLSDWTSGGVSRFANAHDQETLYVRLHSYPDDPEQHHWWEGQIKLLAPGGGGEPRTTEKHDFSWPFIGKPEIFYERDLESTSN